MERKKYIRPRLHTRKITSTEHNINGEIEAGKARSIAKMIRIVRVAKKIVNKKLVLLRERAKTLVGDPDWKQKAPFGELGDAELAETLGVGVASVRNERLARGIRAYDEDNDLEILGDRMDRLSKSKIEDEDHR